MIGFKQSVKIFSAKFSLPSGVARAIELVGHRCTCAKALTTPTNQRRSARLAFASQFQNLHSFIDSDASGKKVGHIRHRSSSFIPSIL